VLNASGPRSAKYAAWARWAPETRPASRDLLIFVEETAEPVEATDAAGVSQVVFRKEGSGLVQGAVRAMTIEMVLTLGQHYRGVALVNDEDTMKNA